MKNIIIIVFFILVAQSLLARADTTNIEQYCQVTATPRLLSNKVTIDIDCGEQKSLWSDTRLREWDGQLKKFNTVIDAMNYMGKEGWGFINAYPIRNGSNNDIYYYSFKKQFRRSELLH